MGSRIVCECESVGATRGYYFRCKCDSKNPYFIPPGIVYGSVKARLMFKDVGIDFFFQVDGGRVWAGRGGEGGDEHI